MGDLGDIGEAGAGFYNSLVALVDKRIEAWYARKEAGVPLQVEEKPIIYEKKVEKVVWGGDPAGTTEGEIVAAPRNDRIRITRVGENNVDVWVPPGLPPFIGVRIACVPSSDPDRPGYVLVGTYGRKGGRLA